MNSLVDAMASRARAKLERDRYSEFRLLLMLIAAELALIAGLLIGR